VGGRKDDPGFEGDAASVPGLAPAPQRTVTESWVAGREAVARFAILCGKNRWIFAEAPEQSDFGKDGYVDLCLPTDLGQVPGCCFAVQIKGGRSRWTSTGFRFDANKGQRDRWMNSTIPVIGIAHDPDTDRICWVDVSALLRTEGIDASISVPRAQHLGGEPEVQRFVRYIASTTQPMAGLLNLGSSDPRLQAEAAFLAWFIGREDGRALVLLRRVMFSLEDDAIVEVIWRMAHCVWHPDSFHTPETTLTTEARQLLQESMRWSDDEIRDLLFFVALSEDGIERGSLGAIVLCMLMVDPDHVRKLEAVTISLGESDDDLTSGWGLMATVGLARMDGPACYERLLSAQPRLANTWATSYVDELVHKCGYLPILE
jgi:hypothetical protein